MRTIRDLLEFLTALNIITALYANHEIDRDEYLSRFDKIIKNYEAIK